MPRQGQCKQHDDGSGRKIAVHVIIGGIMNRITGAGFASGSIGAGRNEALHLLSLLEIRYLSSV